MAKHNVKRIAAKSQSRSADEWDKAWLSPVLERIGKAARLGRVALFASSSTLAYWGALAGIAGSILWGILFLIFQSQEFELSDWFLSSIDSLGYTKLLAVPTLLILFCLIAVFIDQEKRLIASKWLRRAGFTLASLGFISLTMFTLNPYWPNQYFPWLWPNNSGLFNVLNRFYGGTPLSEWVETTLPSFMLVGIGLALFGLAAIRAKALPIWTAMWLVVSSLAVFLIPMGLILIASGGQSYSLLYESGILLWVLLAFGAGWAILGYTLLRSRTSDHNQEHYPSPQPIS
jgi:hypothetical protein